MIEELESRRLCATLTLSNRILTINGTEANDVLEMKRKRVTEIGPTGSIAFVSHVLITLNTVFLGDFSVPSIKECKVNLKGGEDFFVPSSELSLKLNVSAGAGDDTIGGGSKSDILRGGDGNNILVGNGGSDRLISGGGSDSLTGNGGSDTADFSARSDNIFITLNDLPDDGVLGQVGNVKSDIETVIGGGGADVLSVSNVATPVVLMGGGGNDSLFGGVGNDTLSGGPGNDEMHGGLGNDYLNGDGGKDHVLGEDGDDTLNGGGNNPPIIPLPSDQTNVQVTSDGIADVLDGGVGTDIFLKDPFDIIIDKP